MLLQRIQGAHKHRFKSSGLFIVHMHKLIEYLFFLLTADASSICIESFFNASYLYFDDRVDLKIKHSRYISLLNLTH